MQEHLTRLSIRLQPMGARPGGISWRLWSVCSSSQGWLRNERRGGEWHACLITGSSDGLGLLAAKRLIEQGHRSSCTDETRSESSKLSKRQPAPRQPSPGTSYHCGGKGRCREANKLGRIRCHYPQCGHRVSADASRGERTRSSEHIRGQCTRALHSDRTDQETGAPDLCELRDAPGRRTADDDLLWTKRDWGGSSAYAEVSYAMSCLLLPWPGAGRRSIECAGAWLGTDENGRPFGPGRS